MVIYLCNLWSLMLYGEQIFSKTDGKEKIGQVVKWLSQWLPSLFNDSASVPNLSDFVTGSELICLVLGCITAIGFVWGLIALILRVFSLRVR